MKQGDILSKETQFSGLPKSCKIRRDGAHNLSAGIYNPILCDVVEFNYSSALVNLTASVANITIAEPGLYDVIASGSGNGNTDYIVRAFVNAAASSVLQGWTPGGLFPFFNATGVLELKAGDVVDLRIYAGILTTIAAGFASLTVTKLTGRY